VRGSAEEAGAAVGEEAKCDFGAHVEGEDGEEVVGGAVGDAWVVVEYA